MGSRLFGYNSAASISGASQSGNLAVSNNLNAGGSIKWWNGPDESSGYVIGYPDTTGLRKSNGTLIGGNAVGFVRTSTKTDAAFLSLANSLTGQNFTVASTATNWLNVNGYYTSYGTPEDEYKLILAVATSLGYTLPSASQQIKQNQLILDLKVAGVWTRLDVLYVFATDGNNSFATLNWKNPNSNQCTLVNTPTFTTNQGFTGNGVSSYIDTNYNPSTFTSPNYLLNNASLGWWKKTTGTVATSKHIVGVASGRISLVNGNSLYQIINMSFATSQSSATNFSNNGFALANKTGSLAGTNYVTTTTPISYTQAGSTDLLPASNILLLSSNGSGGFLDVQISYFFAGADLNSYVSPTYTAFTNYINTI